MVFSLWYFICKFLNTDSNNHNIFALKTFMFLFDFRFCDERIDYWEIFLWWSFSIRYISFPSKILQIEQCWFRFFLYFFGIWFNIVLPNKASNFSFFFSPNMVDYISTQFPYHLNLVDLRSIQVFLITKFKDHSSFGKFKIPS